MKNKSLLNTVLFITAGMLIVDTCYAGKPLWSFAPLTPTHFNLPANETQLIKYDVRNLSKKKHSLIITPVTGISQITTAGNCPNPIVLAPQEECTLSLNADGSLLTNDVFEGPILCEQGNLNQCYQPSRANSLTITRTAAAPAKLSLSTNDLVLSVTGIIEYGVTGQPSSGQDRTITVTNSSAASVTDLAITFTGLPVGTSWSSTCPSTLPSSNSCTITIDPGSTPSPGCSNGFKPVPAVVTITGSNAHPKSAGVTVLSYGCLYQGGYVYALDDTPAASLSVRGKVSTNDLGGAVWAPTEPGDNVSIYGISETSTSALAVPATGQLPGQTPCNGNSDGACNSNNIIIQYPSYSLSTYAAGLCRTQSFGQHHDWYLPAICEIGYQDSNGSTTVSTCGTVSSPSFQNMRISLNGSFPLFGTYWSSTEYSGQPENSTWFNYSDTTINYQTYQNASRQASFTVRCSRIFNP